MASFWWGVTLIGGSVGLVAVFVATWIGTRPGAGDTGPMSEAQLRADARKLIAEMDDGRDRGQP